MKEKKDETTKPQAPVATPVAAEVAQGAAPAAPVQTTVGLNEDQFLRLQKTIALGFGLQARFAAMPNATASPANVKLVTDFADLVVELANR